MRLLELEKTIKPLTRSEKLQLIADITRMLQEEEKESVPGFPIHAGMEYPVYTPLEADAYAAAAQLQAYVNEGKL